MKFSIWGLTIIFSCSPKQAYSKIKICNLTISNQSMPSTLLDLSSTHDPPSKCLSASVLFCTAHNVPLHPSSAEPYIQALPVAHSVLQSNKNSNFQHRLCLLQGKSLTTILSVHRCFHNKK